MNYIPLQVKTNYSLLSSLINIEKLIKKAKEYNITSLAITDINNLYGTMEFYHACLKNDIKPIIGLELMFNNYSILLYAKNYEGYQSLCKLVTIKSETDITIETLKKYNNNLICILPFNSINLFNGLKNIYQELYLGYSSKEQRDKLVNYHINMVFINNILYLDSKDSEYLPYVYAIRDGKKIEDIKEYPSFNHHLMNMDEVLSLSNEKDINNTIKIGELCNLKFSPNKNLLPIYDDKINAKEYLIELCKKGLNKRLNNNVSNIYIDRLRYELDIINKTNFANYFLVVWDFIKYAKKNNILVGPGRGSSASSLVSYSLGITDVDPIKYDLLFERFLNPERITMPDIDIDFQDIYRDKVIEYVVNKYGDKKVAQIITFGTLGMKQAIRDIGRVMDIPIKLLDKIASMLPYSTKDNIEKIYKNNKNFQTLINSTPSLKRLYEVAVKLEGMPRHTSIHAAGIIISNQELDNVIPLMKSSNGMYTTGYSMEYMEELGLLKMDFLGLKNLTIIMNIIDLIKQNENNKLDFNAIPLDDKETLQIFTNVNTEGIFQFESTGMKNFLRKLNVNSFEDIVAANALFRPGPMDNIDSYIKRKYNREKIDYIHPDLIKILGPTYGIIVYQEQIMQIASIMADYSLGEADVLRRAMGKKNLETMLSEKEKFIKRSMDKHYTKEVAEKVYELILKFANYGFNRAHSVAYSIIGYKMAYLKAHYPKYFMASLLSSVIGSDIKTKEYMYEARLNNINILRPDINLSDYLFKVDDMGVRFSLACIRNVGSSASSTIIKERNNNGKYKDFIDFVCRNYGRNVNIKTIESLVYASCFNSFGFNKKTLCHNLENVINYAELISNSDATMIEEPIMEVVNEYTKEELMEQELEVFGFYLSVHPVTKYKNNYSDLVDIINIPNYFNKDITILAYIDSIKVIKTKNNEEMAFISGSDELSKIDITLFPKTYQNHREIKKGDVIKVIGKVEKRLSTYQLIANKIEIII
jgi:DNA polymerase-3 subunit alpha